MAIFSDFLKKEKIYFILLMFVVLINVSIYFLSGLIGEDQFASGIEEGASSGLLNEDSIRTLAADNTLIHFIFLYILFGFVFFMFIGMVLDITYLILVKRGNPPLLATVYIENAGWTLWDIFKVAIIFLFAQRVIWIMDLLVISGLPYLWDKANLRLMLSATFVDIISVAALIYFVVKERGGSVASIGLIRNNFFRNVKYGAVAYVGLAPILALVMFATAVIFKKLNIPMEPQEVLLILEREKHVTSLIYMGLFTSILGPILEEIFFRGYTYGYFRKKAGAFWGIIISSLFFASIHGNLAGFFPILCLGIMLAYLYEKTGSLVSSITVHVIHNSISFVMLMILKVFIK